MTFYVQRIKLEDPDSRTPFGKIGFVGPFYAETNAQREADAWNGSGTWFAAILDSSPQLKAEIRAWERATKAAA